MARLVSSDGVQVNLFLDLDSNNTGEGTLLYGPKSQPNMDFIVQGFKNFRTNTEFNNRNKLVFHCHHEITVNISSITGANYPTSSNPHVVDSDTQLYYVGDDLVLSTTGMKIYRIDLFKSASTNDVFTVNGASPDASGNVTVTVGNDHSTEITNLTTRVSTLELGGGGGDTGSFSPPEVLWEKTGSSFITWVGHTTNGYNTTTSPHMTDFLGKYGDYYKLVVHTLNAGVEEFFIEDIHTLANTASNMYSNNQVSLTRRTCILWMNPQGNMTIQTAYPISTGNTNITLQRILVYKNPLGGPSDISQLNDSNSLLSSGGGGGRVLVFNSSGTYNKPAGVVGLEILMVAGGSGGGNNPYTFRRMNGTAGGHTTITGIPDGNLIAHGGGTIESAQYNVTASSLSAGNQKYGYVCIGKSGEFGYSSTVSTPLTAFGVGCGEGGYGGKDGGVSIYCASVVPDQIFSNVNLNTVGAGKGGSGGGGVRTSGSAISPPNKSLSGGQGATGTTYSGNASDWNIPAPLGGEAFPSGDNTTYTRHGGVGKFSGGGGGAAAGTGGYYGTQASPGGGGGGGIGAGGGGYCVFKQSYGSVVNRTYAINQFNFGGFAGESITCTITVPSAADSYQIEVGAGGNAGYTNQNLGTRPDQEYSGGGGGQGIVIIKEITDLTISTP